MSKDDHIPYIGGFTTAEFIEAMKKIPPQSPEEKKMIDDWLANHNRSWFLKLFSRLRSKSVVFMPFRLKK